MKARTAGDNRQVTEGAFVPGHGPQWWKILKIFRQRPVQIRLMWTRNQADIFRDFELPNERPRLHSEHSSLRRADGQRDCGFNRRTEMSAGVRVQTGRNIYGEDENFGGIDRRDEFFPTIVQRASQADAEQTVNDEGGTGILPVKDRLEACPTLKFRQRRFRIRHVQ